MNKNIWVISEVYAPDEVGGAYFINKLAEGFATYYNSNINVLCGHPVYTARGTKVPNHEVLNGVRVKRCYATRFNKDIILIIRNFTYSPLKFKLPQCNHFYCNN